jgi:hypothetical protein
MAAKQIIKICCQGSRMVDPAGLVELQGELKTLSEENYQKLKRRMLRLGFDCPVFGWRDKKITYILDGTQRLRALRRMLEEGCQLEGGKVPVCDIEAENIKQARERLLGYVSQYGKLSEEGLMAFLQEGGDETLPEDIDFPDFDVMQFGDKYLNGHTTRELKTLEVKPPPKMAWVLIGIPLVRYGEISGIMEKLARDETIFMESTVNDAIPQNG